MSVGIDLNTTSGYLYKGDLVFAYDDDCWVSGVKNRELFSISGYDGGAITIFLIQEEGNGMVQDNPNPADFIRTGGSGVVGINSYRHSYAGQRRFGTGMVMGSMAEGDVFIEWDENTHGGVYGSWDFSGNTNQLTQNYNGWVNRGVWEITSGGTLDKIQGDCCVEVNAIHLDLVELGTPTNLTALPEQTYGRITWDYDAGDPDHFSLERKSQGDSFHEIAEVNGSSREYEDYTIATGVEFTYRIRPVEESQAGNYSNTDDLTLGLIQGEAV